MEIESTRLSLIICETYWREKKEDEGAMAEKIDASFCVIGGDGVGCFYGGGWVG